MSKLHHVFKLPKTVWGLSLVSLLSNSSSVIISSLSVTLITDVLGGSAKDLGVIRGITEAFGYAMKLCSGMISDYLGRRKILIIIGYTAAAFAKPLYAMASSLWMYFTAQTIDRFTNGLRDAPRDALISESSPKGLKGAGFGLRQSLAALGSTIGAFVAFLLMSHLGGSSEHMVRGAYWFSILPLVLSILILAFMTSDKENTPQLSKRKGFPIKKSDLNELGGRYWFFLFAVFIFMCARSSEAFLVFKAKSVGLHTEYHPLVFGVSYFFTAISAKWVGDISDHLNKKYCLMAGFLSAMISYLILSKAESITAVFISIVIYGIHFGVTQTVLFSMVSDYAPRHIKATSFGILNVVCAAGVFSSSISQGILWDAYGAEITYFVAAALTLLSTILVMFTKPTARIIEE